MKRAKHVCARPDACREERARLVRIANSFGAGHALAAIGFVRCRERHAETDQRCLLGEGHVRDDGYSTHQSENVTWITASAVLDHPFQQWTEKPDYEWCMAQVPDGPGFLRICRRKREEHQG